MDSRVFHDKGDREYRVWEKVYYQRGDLDRYWIVVNQFGEELFLGLFYSWYRLSWAIGGLIVLLIGLLAGLLSNSVIDPIIEMSRAASEVDKGSFKYDIRPELKERRDEIGQLAVAMDYLAKRILESNIQLDQTVKEKTQELHKRMQEMENFNRAMIGREKRMIELKRMINDLSIELGKKPPFDIPGAQKRAGS